MNLRSTLTELSDEFFLICLIHKSESRDARGYQALSIAYSLNHYLERPIMLKLCNQIFREGLDKREINKRQFERLRFYGREEVKFLIELGSEDKNLLEYRIEELKGFMGVKPKGF